MEVRYLNNSYEDYFDERPNSILNNSGTDISDEFREKLNVGTKSLMRRLEEKKRYWYKTDDCSFYTGLSGIAYTFYHYGKSLKDQNYVSKAVKLTEECVASVKGKKHITFLTGNGGPLAFGAIIYNLYIEKEESLNIVTKLKSMASYVIDDNSSVPDELLYGRAGYLYSLLYLNKHMPSASIERSLIEKVIASIISSGKNYAKMQGIKSTLMYAWHDSEYLGGAHGLAGILYLLLQAREFLTNEQLADEIEPALQWLEKLKYPSGNFPSSVGRTTDKLVHWCHGAPSMTMLFGLAYQIYGKEQYLQTSLKCGDVIWQRGLLKKGCGICHGVAGNAYSFLYLFQLTNDPMHLYRAGQFAEWCLEYDEHQTKPADRPFSLFEGLAGTIYFLIDMQQPERAKFPGYTI